MFISTKSIKPPLKLLVDLKWKLANKKVLSLKLEPKTVEQT